MMKKREIYHYTVGLRFLKIVNDGLIKPATEGVPTTEKPAVWFTCNSDWEPTANKRLHNHDGSIQFLNREETAKYGGGLVRIVVPINIAHHDWKAFVRKSGIETKTAQDLKRVADELGSNVLDWRARFSTVPRELWMRIDRWENEQWNPVSISDELIEDISKECFEAKTFTYGEMNNRKPKG
jgi:hypothetical protein